MKICRRSAQLKSTSQLFLGKNSEGKFLSRNQHAYSICFVGTTAKERAISRKHRAEFRETHHISKSPKKKLSSQNRNDRIHQVTPSQRSQITVANIHGATMA